MRSKQASPLPLRLPPDLRTWLRSRALENSRSMNSEVVFVLKESRALAQKREANHG